VKLLLPPEAPAAVLAPGAACAVSAAPHLAPGSVGGAAVRGDVYHFSGCRAKSTACTNLACGVGLTRPEFGGVCRRVQGDARRLNDAGDH
jgi:hypothetical protein